MHMNISEFERMKPTQTYHIIESTIAKYQTLLEKYNHNGQTLLMEDADTANATNARTYQEVVRDLQMIKNTFLSGN